MPDYLSNPEDSSMASTPAPAYGDPGQPAAPQAPEVPPKPGIWGNVLKGALQGLAMGGIPGAVAGAIDPEQAHRNVANQRAMATAQVGNAQSQIRFRDAQSANAVAEAARNNAVVQSMPQQAADAHSKTQLEMTDQLQQLGITPIVISDDHSDAATAALTGLTQSQGSVPHLFNLEVGGQHLAYDLTQLSGSPQGLTIINNARQAQGQDPLTPQQWRSTPKAAQSQAAEGALKFFAPPPTTNAAQAQGLYLQYKSFADAYAKKPDADPATKTKLDKLVSNLKDQRDGQIGQEKSLKSADAYANAAAQKQARLDVDQKAYQEQLASGDVTGWKPKPGAILSEQQFNAANTKFVSGALAKAQDTEKSYEMFNEAFGQRKDAKSGAQSMLALSQHLATTFGTVKGARVTKDMIEHHLGARNVSDSLQVAAQKLINGDVLSENQWEGFRELITNARRQTWNNTVKQAHSMGLPVTSDMLPTQKGK
jgi:hypothetical protein